MKLVADVLDRDPRDNRLVNNGQARIDSNDAETRGELESFVCEGRFSSGIVTIVESFTRDIGRSSQKAAWVSGFYGSGKSHLLKMLVHLWENKPFTDGMKPSQLIRDMPEDVRRVLKELSGEVPRAGGAFAAAGSLLSGSIAHPRAAVLSIILKGAGLPGEYGKARFMLYLKERGLEADVRKEIEAAGSTLEEEVADLYVSPLVAEAMIRDGRLPGTNEDRILEAIRTQFGTPAHDLTNDQFLETVRKVLRLKGREGKAPLTLVVLDEVQIFIGNDQDRAGAIADIAETLSKEFDSRVMVVGAGQSALAGTDQLIRLLDRFTIQIQLDDNDVETVTRKVLLRKTAGGRSDVETMLDANAGAISRQLQGTRVAERPEDRSIRVDDYPLLPVRRRFWEICFRALDRQGTQAQLRSQLRILHDALTNVAERPLGSVVGGDALYEALRMALVQSGDLSRDAHEQIEALAISWGPDGALARRIAAVSFLISRLSREAGADTNIRATPEHIADLVVDDLTEDQGQFRARVRDLVDRMAKKGDVVLIGSEVRIQTAEGRAWETDYRKYHGGYRNDPAALAEERDKLVAEFREEALLQVTRVQGACKTPRRLVPHLDDNPPTPDERNVSLWVRVGWRIKEKEVRDQATSRGSADGVVQMFIPAPSPDLNETLAEMLAAAKTLDQHGHGSGSTGAEARQGMETRRNAARERARDIARTLVGSSLVFVGGGKAMDKPTLPARLEEAKEIAGSRLFPRFREGDFADWEKVRKAAVEGQAHPFAVIGHQGDADGHAVGKAVLGAITVPKSTADIRRIFERSPYGWPQDAVDAALVSLVRLGKLRVKANGDPVGAERLDLPTLGKASFEPEDVAISAKDKIALSGFLKGLVTVTGDDLAGAAKAFLAKLADLAREAGGEAPLPAAPKPMFLDEASALQGNALLRFLLDHRTEMETAITQWKHRADRKSARSANWFVADRLARHANPFPEAAGAIIELKGIKDGRQLLETQDPLSTPLADLRKTLVPRLKTAQSQVAERIREALEELAKSQAYADLPLGEKETINRANGLTVPSLPPTDTDSALADALDAMPLSAWRDALDAVPTRLTKAMEAAARAAEPTVQTFRVERTTLKTPADVEAWVSRQREKLLEAIGKGPALVS